MKLSYYLCILCCMTVLTAQEKTLITSCNVVKQKLEKKNSGVQRDEHYIVTIVGQFPQKNIEIFIGDYQVKNAKISAKNIRFVIEDKSLLKFLQNKMIGHRIKNGDVQYSKVKFVVYSFRNRNNIQITSCTIVPAIVRNGKTNEKKYRVNINGDFPRHMAMVVNIFIGEHEVVEYGGTATGIYFYIDNTKRLKNLHNKNIAYGYNHRIWEISTVKLQVPQRFLK
ncbi:hypothetical protein [Candidatus Uabimicrobium amorphum]|uniref:Uncharacterized protein n=1 Tax=Uabimicrobium amorphum TaxID=2596890 RepID=A0A5S9IQH1_UABAM|nr:hypothetical protein [Candidatus Uabimicrobium amorphum]BBM86034.1 hypothetical protein UABAM_04420 [Candidatus Uabimicrobium amorphum]